MRDEMIYRNNLNSTHTAYIDKYNRMIAECEAMKAQKYNTIDTNAVRVDLTDSSTESDSDSDSDSDGYDKYSSYDRKEYDGIYAIDSEM